MNLNKKQYSPDPNDNGGQPTSFDVTGNSPFDLSDLGINKVDDAATLAAKAKADADAATAKVAADAKAAEDKLAADTAAAKAKTDADLLALAKKDEKGNVILADKIIKIDDIELQLNDKGDAVDKEGKIVKTKEEIDAIVAADPNAAATDTPAETTLIQDIQKSYGVEIVDEHGKPKVYEDSIEGIIQYNKDVLQQQQLQFRKQVFEEMPDVKKYFEFRAKGGTPQNFLDFKEKDWSTVKFTKDSTELERVAAIVELGKKRGYSEAKAAKMAELIKNGGDLESESNEAVVELAKIKVDGEKIENEKLEAIARQDEEQSNKFWTEAEDLIIKKGAFAGIKIPEADKQRFFEYMSKVVDNKSGYSQDQVDATKEGVDRTLFYAALRFYKYDLSKLIQAEVGKKIVANLKSRIAQDKSVIGAGGGNGNKPSGNGTTDFSLDTLVTYNNKQ